MNRITIPYTDARKRIQDGDVLLFHRRQWYMRAVGVAGRSEYVHAAMAGWWGRRLMCVEMTAGGGRAQLLSNLVDRWPGAIDVYGFVPPASWHKNAGETVREESLCAMIEITGCPYGWWNLCRAAVMHLPVLRWFVRPDENDGSQNASPPFCSQAVATAYRRAGADLVRNLADRLTEPGDLARSALLAYRFTIGA